jgi:hypothetical protein
VVGWWVSGGWGWPAKLCEHDGALDRRPRMGNPFPPRTHATCACLAHRLFTFRAGRCTRSRRHGGRPHKRALGGRRVRRRRVRRRRRSGAVGGGPAPKRHVALAFVDCGGTGFACVRQGRRSGSGSRPCICACVR